MILDTGLGAKTAWNNFISLITLDGTFLSESYIHHQLSTYNGCLVLNDFPTSTHRYHIQFDTDADYTFFVIKFA